MCFPLLTRLAKRLPLARSRSVPVAVVLPCFCYPHGLTRQDGDGYGGSKWLSGVVVPQTHLT